MEFVSVLIAAIIYLFLATFDGFKRNVDMYEDKQRSLKSGNRFYMDNYGKMYSTKTDREISIGREVYNCKRIYYFIDLKTCKCTEVYYSETNEPVIGYNPFDGLRR